MNSHSKPVTHVALVVDRSGSMASFVPETLSGFNKQIELLQERGKTQDIFVSLYVFNGEIKIPFTGTPAATVSPLTQATYQPLGSTALYDAVRAAINGLEKNTTADDDNVAYLVLVFTDGQENSSQHTTAKWLRKKVAKLQKTGQWTFTVLGANISLDDLADTLAIPRANMQAYMPTAGGVVSGLETMAVASSMYFTARGQGTVSSTTFYSEDSTDETSA